MKQLICLAYQPWKNASPCRTQQLLSRLKDTEVLYFDPPLPLRSREWHKPGRQVRPNVTVYSLPPIIRDENTPALLRRRSGKRLAGFVAKVCQKHRFRDALLWCTTPEDVFLLEKLPTRGLVYDCDREWDDLPLDWESDLACASDVIFAASPGLAGRLAPCCDNIAVVPNGVNYAMFSKPGLEVPALMSRLSPPVFCCTRPLTPDVETAPLVYAARQHPEWTFLMLGGASPEQKKLLARSPNVLITGPLPLLAVPEYLSACTVCFDLLSEETRGADIVPTRVYQYLATGKPTVAVLDPEQVEPFPDMVYAAFDETGFVRRCEKALEEPAGFVSARRIEHASSAAWTNRASEVARILCDAGILCD